MYLDLFRSNVGVFVLTLLVLTSAKFFGIFFVTKGDLNYKGKDVKPVVNLVCLVFVIHWYITLVLIAPLQAFSLLGFFFYIPVSFIGEKYEESTFKFKLKDALTFGLLWSSVSLAFQTSTHRLAEFYWRGTPYYSGNPYGG